jgi:hypothetical protein
MDSNDRDLYEAFAAVRRGEQARIPAFTRTSPNPPNDGFRGRLVAITACLAVMIAAAVWLASGAPGRRQRPQQATVSLANWKPPTDFLLETPGRELLQDVPALGEWSAVAVAPHPVQRRRRFAKKVLH